jgi:PAS domain S-box-containing protein
MRKPSALRYIAPRHFTLAALLPMDATPSIQTELRVLLLEDLASDAELVERALHMPELRIHTRRVASEAEFASELKAFAPDLILADYSLPGFDGLAALEQVKNHGHDVPFIFVSGTIGEELAIESMRRGATDYVLKTNLKRLTPVVRRALQERNERMARAEAEQALRDSEARYRLLFQNNPHPMWVYDCETQRIVAVNDVALADYGYSREEFMSMSVGHMLPVEDQASFIKMLAGLPRSSTYRGYWRHVRKDGETIDVELLAHDVTFEARQARLVLANDISQQRKAQQALEQERNLLRALIDNLPDHIYTKDRDGRYVINNAENLKILGVRSEGEAAGKTVFDYFPAAIAERFTADDAEVLSTGQPIINREEPFVDPAGNAGWYLTTKVPLRDWQGEITGLVGMSRDITYLKAPQDALRESQSFLQHAMAIGRIGSWTAALGDDDTLIWSHETCRIFGLEPERFDGRNATFLALVHDEDRAAIMAQGDQAIASGTPYEIEYRIVRPDGEVRWLHERAEVQGDGTGRPLRLAGVVQDITGQKLAEQERLRTNQRLRMLSRRLMRVQESERAAISRELHDEIGQAFTALKIHLHGLRRSAEGLGLHTQIDECVRIVDQALHQVRTLSIDLRPPQLDDFGLVPALRSHLGRIPRPAGLEIILEADAQAVRADSDVETACFRIVQEAITNVLRHSGATLVKVQLQVDDGKLLVCVRDNGGGFDPEQAREQALRGHRIGLLGMQERATLLGGRIRITSAPGAGTDIVAAFPLGQSHDNSKKGRTRA